MNVLIISPRFPPSIGGIEYIVSRLACYLAGHGFNVTVATTDAVSQRPFTRFKYIGEQKCGRLKVLRFPCFGFVTGYIPISPNIFLWCIRNISSYDVIHVNGYGFITSDLIALLASLYHKPVVLTTHGVSQEVLIKYIYRPSIMNIIRMLFYIAYKKILLSLSLRVYSRIVIVSRFEVNMLPKSIADKIIHICNGVDFNEWSIGELDINEVYVKKSYGVDFGECMLLYMGRLDVGKGVDFLLKSISGIKNLNFKLVIASPKSIHEHKIVELINELNVKDYVLLVGPRIGLEKIKLLKAADIIVVPSIYELFYPPEISVIEGVVAGKPVVTVKPVKYMSDHPVRDQFNGFLVNYNNVDELTEALKILIKDENLRRKFSRNSLELGKSYSLSVMLDKYIKVYCEALRSHCTSSTHI